MLRPVSPLCESLEPDSDGSFEQSSKPCNLKAAMRFISKGSSESDLK